MRVLVEVVNIHIKSEKAEKDPNKINKVFTNRLDRKLLDKKNGLTENLNIHLVPVIWGNYSELEIYSDFFNSYLLNLELTYGSIKRFILVIK